MNERRFTAMNGEVLIVCHRRSAVLFHRQVDLTLTNRYERPGDAPYVAHSELRRAYRFDETTWRDLLDHLDDAARRAWSTVSPREADSCSSDYGEYYDKPFDNNGYLRVNVEGRLLTIEAPNQPKSNDPVIRMYQFNKRRFESFRYDLDKNLNKTNPTKEEDTP